jgi:nucleoside-specific outer membrane channel protein Tsx
LNLFSLVPHPAGAPRGYHSRVMHRARTGLPCRWAAAVLLLLAAPAGAAAQTEFHYQYGNFVNPFSGERAYASVLTVQLASRWSLGDSFIFIDWTDDGGADGFNEKSVYSEWYPTLSLGRVTNRTIGAGPLRDVAFVSGFNFGSDADIFKYVPGGRLSWDVPGFFFLNTDFGAAIDKSSGVARGGAPRTGVSFIMDVNWGAAFDVGSQSFLFAGHTKYDGATTDELGRAVKASLLAQPQIGWDLGKAMTGHANQLFLGVEYQYWWNKLGVDDGDNVAQLWLMWRL